MASDDTGTTNSKDNTNERLITSEADKTKAAKWFQRGRELGDKRQFDYAIEYYVNGLEFWPDAVEEGCKPLHGCAVARRQTGGKRVGFADAMKRSMTDKDARKALVNALWLFGHDPDNLSFMEGIVRAATRLGALQVGKWAGGVLLKALESNSKATPKQLQSLANLLETLGDKAAGSDDTAFAVSIYQMGVDVLNVWQRRHPHDRAVEAKVRDLSTKLTILKGKYQKSESFRDSIVDREQQAELHDRDRSVQTGDRMAELIASAEAAFEQNPDDERCLRELVDLLCRSEQDESECHAIEILLEQFKRTNDYHHRRLADDIRMRQLARHARLAAKAGDPERLKELQIASLRFDLAVYKDRVQRYPTDNRIKYEYAVRLFRAGRFDEAIPVFQTARTDPKNRTACAMYLGRCFFRKKYYSQAIKTLQDELAAYDYGDDDLAKSLMYWLARAAEASGDVVAARDTYGRILQMDYNFKDVRAKLDALPASG
ncbi:MAG: tol-pal system YbgF family protein [Phycisphaerae bacterium]